MATREPVRETLPGPAYHSDETYQIDQERVFYRNWIYVGRAERLPKARVVAARRDRRREHPDRARQGRADPRLLQRLPPPRVAAVRRRAGAGAQHAALSRTTRGATPSTGSLRQHPDDRERRDRPRARPRSGRSTSTSGRASSSSTSPARSRGRCSSTSPTSRTTRSAWPGSVSAELRIGHISTIDVQANWKIVHGELQRVPALPDDPPRADGRRAGVQEGLHLRGRPRRRRGHPGRRAYVDRHRPAAAPARCCPASRARASREAYFGALVYPTMFLDVDGSTCLATAVFPTGPQSCRLVTEYLFTPEALEDPDFDPSPVVEFNELVTRQDNEACERVQRRRAPHGPSTTGSSRPRTPGSTASTSATCATSRR